MDRNIPIPLEVAHPNVEEGNLAASQPEDVQVVPPPSPGHQNEGCLHRKEFWNLLKFF